MVLTPFPVQRLYAVDALPATMKPDTVYTTAMYEEEAHEFVGPAPQS